MSGLLFNRIATTVLAVVIVGVPVSFAFAADPAGPFTPLGPSTGGLGERSATPPVGNSRGNSALLVTPGLSPGDSRSETVTVTNQGGTPAAFELSKTGLWEEPGQGGGKLSTKLMLRIDDVTDRRPPRSVYRGALGAMRRQLLGSFAAGEARTYRFTATFPDGGAPSGGASGDNAYMGGSVTVDFHWTARA